MRTWQAADCGFQSAHREEIERCSQALMQDYGLSNDPDVLFGLADELYTSMRYSDCFSVTTKYVDESRQRDTRATTDKCVAGSYKRMTHTLQHFPYI